MNESAIDKLRSIYTNLDNRREFAIDEAIDDLHELIGRLSESNQQAVIRARNGEVDDIWIESVDVHLERMDRDEWSLLFYRGNERVGFTIKSRDSWPKLDTYVSLTEDTIGCEREEQGE